MKKKIWLYLLAAAAAAGLAAILIGNRDILQRVPLMALSVLIGLVLMLGVALMAVWIMRRKQRREEKFREGAVPVTGIVARVERLPVKKRQGFYGMGDDLYLLRAIYDYEGKRYTCARRSYFGRPECVPGDPITVYVDPKNPEHCMILATLQELNAKTTV